MNISCCGTRLRIFTEIQLWIKFVFIFPANICGKNRALSTINNGIFKNFHLSGEEFVNICPTTGITDTNCTNDRWRCTDRKITINNYLDWTNNMYNVSQQSSTIQFISPTHSTQSYGSWSLFILLEVMKVLTHWTAN